MVRQSTGVKENRTQRGESASYQHFLQHYLTSLSLHDPPIVLDMSNTSSERGSARTKVTVFDCVSQAEADRTEKLDFNADVLLAK